MNEGPGRVGNGAVFEFGRANIRKLYKRKLEGINYSDRVCCYHLPDKVLIS